MDNNVPFPLEAALLGKEVVNNRYRRGRIIIAFHPIEERFEVANPAIRKDPEWINDISTIFDPDFKVLDFLNEYCGNNGDVDQNEIFDCNSSFTKYQGPNPWGY